MNKKELSNKELFSLNVLLLINFYITENYLFHHSPYSYIFVSLSFVFSVLLLFMYNKILIKNPGKNMFEIIDTYFYKFLAFIIKLFYIIFFIFSAIIDARLLILFLNKMVLDSTSIFIIALLFMFLCMILSMRNLNAIGRFSSMIFLSNMVIIFITIIFSISQLDFTNILVPFKPDNVMQNILISICYPFGKIVSILFFANNLTKKEYINKVTYSSLITSFILSMLIILRNIFFLGIPTLTRVVYPSYIAVGLIKIGELLSRFEIIVAFNYMVCALVSASLYTHISSVGIKTIFNKIKYKSICKLICFIIFIGVILLDIDNYSIYSILSNNIYFIILLFVVIPFLSFLFGIIKGEG